MGQKQEHAAIISVPLNQDELDLLIELENRLKRKRAPILRIAIKVLASLEDDSIREMIDVLKPRL